MPAIPPMIEAFGTLGIAAPECDECEGAGTVTYLHGPYVHTRECDSCHGAGHRLACPSCSDGMDPHNGDTCRTCEGFAVLY
ncbi:hypothetical protein ACQF36_44650 [Streptomyces sp. Marseille-Q5077]|uniref:hypothetical protein n=1 Tax=Streptomyces sp. Marseille-Q5077 TaxID=3418995 RepID=UPI003CFDFAE8